MEADFRLKFEIWRWRCISKQIWFSNWIFEKVFPSTCFISVSGEKTPRCRNVIIKLMQKQKSHTINAYYIITKDFETPGWECRTNKSSSRMFVDYRIKFSHTRFSLKSYAKQAPALKSFFYFYRQFLTSSFLRSSAPIFFRGIMDEFCLPAALTARLGTMQRPFDKGCWSYFSSPNGGFFYNAFNLSGIIILQLLMFQSWNMQFRKFILF